MRDHVFDKKSRIVLVSSQQRIRHYLLNYLLHSSSNLFAMRFSITAAVLGLLFYAGATMAQDVGEPCPADQAGMYNIICVLFSGSQFGGVNRRYWLREHTER